MNLETFLNYVDSNLDNLIIFFAVIWVLLLLWVLFKGNKKKPERKTPREMIKEQL